MGLHKVLSSQKCPTGYKLKVKSSLTFLPLEKKNIKTILPLGEVSLEGTWLLPEHKLLSTTTTTSLEPP